jgi:hypothetical protein
MLRASCFTTRSGEESFGCERPPLLRGIGDGQVRVVNVTAAYTALLLGKSVSTLGGGAWPADAT